MTMGLLFIELNCKPTLVPTSSQVYKEYSQGQTICWGTKLVSINLSKKIGIAPSVFSNHNSMKLEISYKKHAGKTTHVWEVNMPLNNYWVKGKVKKRAKDTQRQAKMTI